MTTLQDTPSAERIHIGIFGKRNSGKSSLLNAICGQDVAIVSDTPGTTTDPVKKVMEIAGLGACVLIDTAGIDETDELGLLRVKKTYETIKQVDLAILAIDIRQLWISLELTYWDSLDNIRIKLSQELELYHHLKEQNIPVLLVITKGDLFYETFYEERILKGLDDGNDTGTIAPGLKYSMDFKVVQFPNSFDLYLNGNKYLKFGNYAELSIIQKGIASIFGETDSHVVSTRKAANVEFDKTPFFEEELQIHMDVLLGMIRIQMAKTENENTIFGNLLNSEDVVLFVMPQDIQAPKGRLILPQVQSLREALDRHAIVVSTTTEQLGTALACLKQAPKLIVTDSQVFDVVYEQKPKGTILTSFSVLFAAYKGDIQTYLQGIKRLKHLTNESRVLITECCTHAPQEEDIGRVKIPRLLKQRFGEEITIEIVSGDDFPANLKQYDLIIQCGGCMFNRKHILSRIEKARKEGVPITNYGLTIAYMKGILEKVYIPKY